VTGRFATQEEAYSGEEVIRDSIPDMRSQLLRNKLELCVLANSNFVMRGICLREEGRRHERRKDGEAPHVGYVSTCLKVKAIDTGQSVR
jgi:hypothetical protein